MNYESTASATPAGVKSMAMDDLSFTSEAGLEPMEQLPDAELLRTIAAIIVEPQDYGGADALSAVELLREKRPELAAKYRECDLRAIASLILGANPWGYRDTLNGSDPLRGALHLSPLHRSGCKDNTTASNKCRPATKCYKEPRKDRTCREVPR